MTQTAGAFWEQVLWGILMIVALGAVLLIIAGTWKTFEKADRPGWASLIPFYNNYILVRIAQIPLWYLALQFSPLIIPVVMWASPAVGVYVSMITAIISIGASIYIMMEVARQFDKNNFFALGLMVLPFVFIPILGFGKAEYLDE